jgi:hypothetical protein
MTVQVPWWLYLLIAIGLIGLVAIIIGLGII